MSKIHDAILEQAKEAIEDVFSDTTIKPEETVESLMDLRDLIDLKVSCIKADLKRAAPQKGKP